MQEFTYEIDRSAEDKDNIEVTVQMRHGVIHSLSYQNKEIELSEKEEGEIFDHYHQLVAEGYFKRCYKDYR